MNPYARHDPKVVTENINNSSREIVKESLLTETLGKIHDYVGMIIDYSVPWKVKFSVYD